MLSEHDTREIKEYEKRGLNVVVIGSDGTLKYSSNDINNDNNPQRYITLKLTLSNIKILQCFSRNKSGRKSLFICE